MAAAKTSALPTVLKQYAPEYEPKFDSPKREIAKGGNLTVSSSDHKPHGGDHKAGNQKTDHHKSTDHHKQSKHGKEGKRKNEERLSRDSSFAEAAQKRYDRNYAQWQQAKVETKDTETRILKEKILLQQELIRTQDELYQKKQEVRDRRQRKKREAERITRQAKEEALRQICRESLEDDRKAKDQRREKQKLKSEKSLKSSGEEAQLSHPSAHSTRPSLSPLGSTDGQSQALSVISMLSSKTRETHHGTEMEGIQEEKTMDFPCPYANGKKKSKKLTEEQKTNLPWHHLQLYELYGDEADDFLYPKMEQTVQKQINPNLRKQGGRAGAEVLWGTLRGDTTKRLMRADGRIPGELKNAYGAFVREGLDQGRRPVMRNFCATEDVPDMPKLLDQSVLTNARDLRHKLGLMFRGTQINADKTKVLIFNNPLPDFNNAEGEESISRYLPSWMPDNWDEESEHSYKKWLISKESEPSLPIQPLLEQQTSFSLENIPEDQELALNQNSHGDLSNLDLDKMDIGMDMLPIEDQWSFLNNLKQIPKSSKSRIHFLTEKEATVPGQFSRKYKELEESRTIPQAVSQEAKQQLEQQKQQYSQQPETPRSATGVRSALSIRETDSRKSRSRTAPPNSSEFQYIDRYTSKWQPLDMHALLEYTDNKGAPGEGKFRTGQTKMFKVA
ncbi:uncharacterized protein LOC106151939 [Lingula anatina]|uniref:Uncharacterized protein LOC106151939 n=1 Tax=Lingula anatina TaxID=7574 RepID=A0A1S3H6T1_LINAN|nr:uncharacterized protein LOC106151939 [Lingula anatina]|eukprot:XP_013380834.1 uncharacterized protein LOC106151939 [Lingula anatina]